MDDTSELFNRLRSQLQIWGAVLTASPSQELHDLLVSRYSHWTFHACFPHCLPASAHQLRKGSRSFGYVWDAKRIIESLVEEDSMNDRFLPVLSLADGSLVCIDTSACSLMQLVSFPFELCSGWEAWNFCLEARVPFPFQYPDYLHYLHTTPNPQFLFGDGGGTNLD